jgi:hypothetical protein
LFIFFGEDQGTKARRASVFVTAMGINNTPLPLVFFPFNQTNIEVVAEQGDQIGRNFAIWAIF